MAPLLLHDITIDGKENIVGIFGCTLLSPSSKESLLSKCQRLASEMKVNAQLVDAERIASPVHLLFATFHALQAYHHGTQRAKTLGMEILRYAAAQRQITRALESLGVTHSTTQVGGVLLDQSQDLLHHFYTKLLSEINAEDTPQVLEISDSSKAEAVKSTFNISVAEIEAVLTSKYQTAHFDAIAKLVCERCALLSIEK